MDNQEPNPPLSPRKPAPASMPSLDSKGAARRRFTRLGAGATGVILTLHSHPGMAAKGMAGNNAMCVAPSGFMSVTPTSFNPQNACSGNRSHGYWKNHPEAWKSRAGIDPNAKFGKIFRTTGTYEGLAEVSLMDVINPNDTVKAIDHNNVAMQTVAALLNARAASYAGLPSVLPEESVMEMWNEFVVHGYYTPRADATIWNGAQLAEYLESTFR